MVDEQRLAEAKSAQRNACRELLAAMSPGERARASASICSQLLELLEATNPQTVMGYMPLDDEPDILPFLAKAFERGIALGVPRITGPGSMVAAPVFSLEPDGWIEGTHGIRTPLGEDEIQPGDIDMILVPGLGFDERCNRLGRGGGYYDRFLQKLDGKPLVVGCCFQCQLRESIETGPGDARLSKIIMSSTDN